MKQKVPFFLEDFPEVEDDGMLREVQNEHPELDAAYVTAACIPERRRWIEALWNRYWAYADENYVIEVKTDGKFNERTWEMYLGCVFLSKKYAIKEAAPSGPDFNITLEGKSVWIEATAPNRGEVDSPPPRPVLEPGVIYTGGGDVEQTNRPKILRFTAGFVEKERKYHEYIKQGAISKNDCYVIAINAFNFSGLIEDVDYYTRRVFLAMGCLSYTLMPDGKLGTQPSAVPQPFVEKRTEVGMEKIRTDYFMSEDFSHISGVLLCVDHIVQSPKDWMNIGRNITLLRNPHAKNPLPKTFGAFAREWELNGGTLTLVRE